MPEVRELPPAESHRAAAALLELRPHLRSAEAITERVDALRPEGYRVVASFEDGDPDAAAVAGFRVGDNLVSGRHVYVEDLVTRDGLRGRGHADAVMSWVENEARRQRCRTLELDSAVGPDRADAHRFYFRHGMRIFAFHFARGLD